jgi:hypothetical protein
MAYRFASPPDDWVQFAATPLVGSLDAVTVAAFLLRSSIGSSDTIVSFNSSALALRGDLRLASDNKPYWFDGSNFPNGTQLVNSTSTYYLVAFTKPAGSATPRFHVHNGTSWSHVAGSSVAAAFTIVSGDKLRVAINDTTSNPLGGDIVCVGVKKADSADLTIENLSRTAFSAWQSFGFDWLIGFDSSFVSGGVLQDQGAAGTGDETVRSGTTLVSDPAGWAWVSGPPVANFTGTPTSGSAPLSVTFTDTSTNSPSSWLWDFGDGSTSTSQNPTHSYTSSGVYTVSLTATNSGGSNTKTSTAYVTVTEAIVYASGGGLDIWR